MFFGRSKSKLRKAVFIIITVLIAIGLVIPLASLFQNQPQVGGNYGTDQGTGTLYDRLPDLEAKAKENPGDIAVLMELAKAYDYTGKPDQAVKTYEQVLAVDAGYSDARYKIAENYYLRSKYDQAEKWLNELVQNDPEYKDAYLLHGYVLGQGKKDYAGGIQELEKFIALAKEGPDVEKAKLIINEWKTEQAKQ